MRTFFPHEMRGTPRYPASHVQRQGVGIPLDEQMDVVWRECQVTDLPFMFFGHLTPDLFEAVT